MLLLCHRMRRRSYYHKFVTFVLQNTKELVISANFCNFLSTIIFAVQSTSSPLNVGRLAWNYALPHKTLTRYGFLTLILYCQVLSSELPVSRVFPIKANFFIVYYYTRRQVTFTSFKMSTTC